MYAVNDIYVCIQGEGVQHGVPMILVRLQGCPVGCPWCDTKETWVRDETNRTTLTQCLGMGPAWAMAEAEEIATLANALKYEWHGGPRWILLTGGEPADQDLKELVTALHDKAFLVAIETSGTALGHIGAGIDWVTISPKINMPGGRKVLREAMLTASEIKHVVGKERDIIQLDELMRGLASKAIISLQPVSQSKKATKLCIETCQRRGWNLSIQMHKYLGLR